MDMARPSGLGEVVTCMYNQMLYSLHVEINNTINVFVTVEIAALTVLLWRND